MHRRRSRWGDEGAFLSDALARARKEANMSQELLARRAQVSVGTVRNIEQQVSTDPGVFEVAALASALGVSIETLLPATLPNPSSENQDGEESKEVALRG